ncbi:ABC transporter ATP-binding protein [Oleiagrimonas citrea]|uniref:ABC transporter ATP-binding protein n=1 Tax=Oleiagrimonas citrea TaxID=1665687 RepID=A0A846ZL77_9GAMM|nr:ABC transporter ATP-binding protein [Oleiagrimonas citrea]NKZ38280.1 ABC transporter ATP-binding protein [Oleiagrimonas citrea]
MSSDELAISVRGLGKRYEIYERPKDRLKQMIMPRLQRLTKATPKAYFREFWALQDLSLEVRRGEAVGILGRNGSGKSTFLQLVCGTLHPTTGEVKASGRVAALLELGAGFNPEFTGRENVFLSGLIYGIAENELRARFEEIVEFAEIGEYIDQPVKTYSSGMYVRLAFAVAAFCDPEILIVDEALAVGDVYFQRKCFRRIAKLRERGCTLLFVTHSIDVLLRLCDRGVVLDHGRMIYDGEAKPAVAAYLQSVFGTHTTKPNEAEDEVSSSTSLEAEDVDESTTIPRGSNDTFAVRPGYNRDEVRVGDGSAQLIDFAFKGVDQGSPVLHAGERFALQARYRFRDAAEKLIFGVQVRTRDGISVYSANTFTCDGSVHQFDAKAVVMAEFDMVNTLLPGQYFLSVGVSRFDEAGEIVALDRRIDAIVFTVIGEPRHASGLADMRLQVEVAAEADVGEAR